MFSRLRMFFPSATGNTAADKQMRAIFNAIVPHCKLISGMARGEWSLLKQKNYRYDALPLALECPDSRAEVSTPNTPLLSDIRV